MRWAEHFDYRDGQLHRKGSDVPVGYVENTGYVRLTFMGKKRSAHVVIWEMH